MVVLSVLAAVVAAVMYLDGDKLSWFIVALFTAALGTAVWLSDMASAPLAYVGTFDGLGLVALLASWAGARNRVADVIEDAW
ncbi:hypothetical protein IPG36_07935 [bacterium]|nr:MAG: hypothetical protein IPG36_07935 [bacterium]